MFSHVGPPYLYSLRPILPKRLNDSPLFCVIPLTARDNPIDTWQAVDEENVVSVRTLLGKSTAPSFVGTYTLYHAFLRVSRPPTLRGKVYPLNRFERHKAPN